MMIIGEFRSFTIDTGEQLDQSSDGILFEQIGRNAPNPNNRVRTNSDSIHASEAPNLNL
jgi:hypothetical protein